MFRCFERSRLKYAAAGTVFFFLAANAFILFNYIPQHDSLNYVSRFSDNWELRLGRFTQPVYGWFRGIISSPVLVGLISVICLTAMTCMLTDLMRIRRPFFIVLSAAFLSANISQTELLSSFLYVEDVCMTAALLACLSVYIVYRTDQPKWLAAAAAAMFLSLGLYQAFISFAAVLVLLLLLQDLLRDGGIGPAARKKALRTFGVMAAAGVLYYLAKALTLRFAGVSEAQDYHSLSHFLQDIGSLPSRIFVAYGSKISMFFIREDMNIGRIGNCLLALAGIFLVGAVFRKRNAGLKPRLVFAAVFLLSTAAALMVNIGAGMVAYRLSFAVFLYYLFIIAVMEMIPDLYPRGIAVNKAAAVFLCMVIWGNIVYSNGAYTVQKVIFDRSISLYTRVLDDIYEIPEYVHNQTPVVIIGDWTFDDYAYNLSKKEYRDLGTFLNTSVTYRQTVKSFMRYLGEDMDLVLNEKTIEKVAGSPEVQGMPSFPEKGYIRMADGYLVINF